VTLQEQIRSNRLRTALVLLGFAALTLAFVAVVAGAYNPGIAGVVGIVAIVYGLFSWFAAGRIIAAASGAHPVTKAEQPELYRILENVAIAAGMPKTPDLYMIDDPSPNAFAAGRNPEHAYVAVTTGLTRLLDERELEGVLAHEVSHIRNRDVRLMSLAAVLVGVIALASDMLMRITIFGGGGDRRDGGLGAFGAIIGIIAAILAPIGAALLQMALSRRREYLADASAVETTGDPEGLARALAALRDDHQPLRKVTRATAHLYIESPLRDHRGLRSSLGGLFDTHPPLEDRIRVLEEVGGFQLPPPRDEGLGAAG
jgi:heat shock protein HtpX